MLYWHGCAVSTASIASGGRGPNPVDNRGNGAPVEEVQDKVNFDMIHEETMLD